VRILLTVNFKQVQSVDASTPASVMVSLFGW
jgi:hypothetical protein